MPGSSAVERLALDEEVLGSSPSPAANLTFSCKVYNLAMKEEVSEPRWHRMKVVKHGGGAAPLYGIGVLGALVYFIQHSASFSDGLIGIVKAFFWPALLVYKALEQLKF